MFRSRDLTATGAAGRAGATLTEVRKRYGRGRWVLDGVTLAVPPGQITVIAGNNGSGKSTLLRIAAGAAAPTSGTAERPRNGTAYSPERLPASSPLSARCYLDHMGRLRGLGAAETRRRGTELCERLDLQPGPDVRIGTLSKGNAQKVALAQALLTPPQLLVLDEPCSGLDGDAIGAVIDLVGRAARDGAAVVVSTHAVDAFAGAHTAYELAGGTVRPAAVPATAQPVAGPMLLVLRSVGRTVGGGADPDDLAGWPEVESVEAAAGVARVITRAGDDVLRRALAAGWSLVEAGPVSEREP